MQSLGQGAVLEARRGWGDAEVSSLHFFPRLFLLVVGYLAIRSRNMISIFAVVCFNVYLVICGRKSPLVLDTSTRLWIDSRCSFSMQSSKRSSELLCLMILNKGQSLWRGPHSLWISCRSTFRSFSFDLSSLSRRPQAHLPCFINQLPASILDAIGQLGNCSENSAGTRTRR